MVWNLMKRVLSTFPLPWPVSPAAFTVSSFLATTSGMDSGMPRFKELCASVMAAIIRTTYLSSSMWHTKSEAYFTIHAYISAIATQVSNIAVGEQGSQYFPT